MRKPFRKAHYGTTCAWMVHTCKRCVFPLLPFLAARSELICPLPTLITARIQASERGGNHESSETTNRFAREYLCTSAIPRSQQSRRDRTNRRIGKYTQRGMYFMTNVPLKVGTPAWKCRCECRKSLLERWRAM
jgi:hypothetical protein